MCWLSMEAFLILLHAQSLQSFPYLRKWQLSFRGGFACGCIFNKTFRSLASGCCGLVGLHQSHRCHPLSAECCGRVLPFIILELLRSLQGHMHAPLRMRILSSFLSHTLKWTAVTTTRCSCPCSFCMPACHAHAHVSNVTMSPCTS